MFVKPANLGLERRHLEGQGPRRACRSALDLAGSFDRKIVVEAAVPEAREIECAVLGNDAPEASVAGEVIPSREFYDYEAKYIDDRSQVIIPADLTPAQAEDGSARLSIAAFRRSTAPAWPGSTSCSRAPAAPSSSTR